MTWVTKRQIKVNRAATAWLIRRFIDPEATFLFVEPEHVAEVQQREGATGFDAPGATYPHQDAADRCSFEALVAAHCANDPALVSLARIVVVPGDEREAVRDRAQAGGLRREVDLVAEVRAAHETVERAGFLYDALCAALQARLAQQSRS